MFFPKNASFLYGTSVFLRRGCFLQKAPPPDLPLKNSRSEGIFVVLRAPKMPSDVGGVAISSARVPLQENFNPAYVR